MRIDRHTWIGISWFSIPISWSWRKGREGKRREENNSTMQPVSRLFCFISLHRLGYYACFSDHVNYNHLLLPVVVACGVSCYLHAKRTAAHSHLQSGLGTKSLFLLQVAVFWWVTRDQSFVKNDIYKREVGKIKGVEKRGTDAGTLFENENFIVIFLPFTQCFQFTLLQNVYVLNHKSILNFSLLLFYIMQNDALTICIPSTSNWIFDVIIASQSPQPFIFRLLPFILSTCRQSSSLFWISAMLESSRTVHSPQWLSPANNGGNFLFVGECQSYFIFIVEHSTN